MPAHEACCVSEVTIIPQPQRGSEDSHNNCCQKKFIKTKSAASSQLHGSISCINLRIVFRQLNNSVLDRHFIALLCCGNIPAHGGLGPVGKR